MLLARITLALTIVAVVATVLLVSRAGGGRVFLMDLGREPNPADRARVTRVRVVAGLCGVLGVAISFWADDPGLLVFVATLLPMLPMIWMLVEVTAAVRSSTLADVPARFRVPLEKPPSAMSFVSVPLQIAQAALIALSCASFVLIRSQLPDRVPMHFDFQGNVNRWGNPDELWMMLGLMLFDYALMWLIVATVARERWALPSEHVEEYVLAQRRRRSLMVRMVEALMLFVNASMAVAWLGIAVGSLPGRSAIIAVSAVSSILLSTAGIVISLVAFIGPLVRVQDRIKKLAGTSVLGTHASGWRWGGLVYYAPADPALFVPKRFGIGQTLNFARPAAWVVLLVLLALPMGIAAASVVLAKR